jgi:lipopolysaccharide/colanic/teichoic acid biosynthesis glycosyltransferase
VIHRPVTFEGGACMPLESNKSVARVAQTTIQEEGVAVVGLEGWTKRLVDIILATMGLILFAPILLLVSLAIRLDSGSPIFIREALPGCNNDKATRVLRFRVAFAAGNRLSPRMTRVGQILSLTGIDELPQLINVLRGEMSIVGRQTVGRWPASIC